MRYGVERFSSAQRGTVQLGTARYGSARRSAEQANFGIATVAIAITVELDIIAEKGIMD